MSGKSILFLLLVFMCESAVAIQLPLLQRLDTLTHRSWTLEDGLPVNTVNSIAQDSLGYLWITTYDGLVRFDGINFETFNYSNTPAMPHNRSTLIHIQDGVGTWVALEYGGVILIQDGNFKHFGDDTGFTSSDITKIMEASDGRMFFITHIGLYVYDGKRFSKAFKSDIDRQNQIHDIVEADDQTFWLGTNHGVLHLKNGEITPYFISPEQKDVRIFGVHQTAQGAIIAASEIGIFELKNGQLQNLPKYNALAGTVVQDIYEDDQILLYLAQNATYKDKGDSIELVPGHPLKPNETYNQLLRDRDETLWLVGDAGTLSIFQNSRLEKLSDVEEVKDLYFNNIFEDREGIIWLSSNTSGLIHIRRSKVRTLGQPEGLSGDNVLAMFEESPQRYWVGTRGHGINLLEGDKVTTYEVADGLASNIIQAIGKGPDDHIWIGYHQKGVDKITQNGFEHYAIGNNVETNDVHSIFTSSSGQLWVGTYGGLVKFNPDNEDHKFFGLDDGMAGYKVRYITEDDQGALWVGTLDGGVSRFYNGEFTNYTIENGLSSNNVRSIYVDEFEPGTIWVGTENNGLNRIKNGKVTFINTEDGLPDHIVHWISQDTENWLWASSNRGIFRIDKTELNKYLDGETGAFTLLHFGREEGMRNPEANGSVQEAGLRTATGDFWFATQEGVAIFESKPNGANNIPPNIFIKKIQAGNVGYDTPEVQIPRGHKNFDVSFHALTFAAPEKTRFRYRLNGYDQDWVEVFGKRTISYVNVPAGEYTFEVTAANSDGVWSPKPAIATISIQPFFYEQVWFYVLVVIIIGVGYYSASQIRYNYLVRKQEQLEEIIQEQTAQLRKEKSEIEQKSKIIKQQADELEESNKTKDKFFSLIAHDLRNPFQAILGYSEMMLDEVEEADRKELKTSLEHIHSSSKSLLELVEHLLSWASLQTGRIQPKPEKVNLLGLIERTHQLFEHVAKQKNITFEKEHDEALHLNADLNMLQTIMRNIISNAIKFTPNDGKIKTSLFEEGEFYVITVEDSGIGMSQKLIDELLRLDSNTSRPGTNSEQGSGLGLLICREMIAVHNGEIEVKSTVGTGTIFTLKFPKKGLPVSPNNIEKNSSE
jgi:signal transduction histidine kinase/ligand-binding sensor domain-containing protein